MKYRVECSVQMIEGLKQMNQHSASIILAWVRKYLEGCADPGTRGCPIRGGCARWRYTIGNYRVLAEIQREQGCVLLLWVGSNDDLTATGNL